MEQDPVGKTPIRSFWIRYRVPVALLCVAIFAAAIVVLVPVIRHETRPGARYYERGADLAAQSRFEEASQQWKRGIREDPGDDRCYIAMAELCMSTKRYAEAASNYQAAAKISENPGPLYFKLAQLQREGGTPKDAVESARKAAELMPQDAEAAGLYGMLSEKHYDYSVALVQLQKAHALKPSDGPFLLALVLTEMDLRQLDNAERDLKPYLERNPSDASAQYLMAVIYNQKPRTASNIATAIHHAEVALPGLRANALEYNLLGQLYLDTGRTQDALHVFQQGIHELPSDRGIIHGLIECFRRLGDTKAVTFLANQLDVDEARNTRLEFLKHRLGFNHADVAAGIELAKLYEANDDMKQAESVLLLIVQSAPDDQKARAALADFHRRVGHSGSPIPAPKP